MQQAESRECNKQKSNALSPRPLTDREHPKKWSNCKMVVLDGILCVCSFLILNKKRSSFTAAAIFFQKANFSMDGKDRATAPPLFWHRASTHKKRETFLSEHRACGNIKKQRVHDLDKLLRNERCCADYYIVIRLKEMVAINVNVWNTSRSTPKHTGGVQIPPGGDAILARSKRRIVLWNTS